MNESEVENPMSFEMGERYLDEQTENLWVEGKREEGERVRVRVRFPFSPLPGRLVKKGDWWGGIRVHRFEETQSALPRAT